MVRKTDIDEEVSERIDYFADWVKRLSDERDESRVVNDRTAREFIRNAFSKDASLSNLLDGMESTGKGMDVIVGSDYVQGLIQSNNLGKRLDVAVAKLRKKRESLEQMIPKKNVVVRRKVINKFTTASLLKKYNIIKTRNGRYRDTRNGRYVGFDKILRVTDLVILSSAKKRRDLELFMEKVGKK